MDSNQTVPASSAVEDDKHNSAAKDDAATMAASEELKHTTISDKIINSSKSDQTTTRLEPAGDKMLETVKESTPDAGPTDAQNEEMREKISSPKKKRARDTYDDSVELEGDHDESVSSADGSAVNGRSEGPEKKRPRDTSEGPKQVANKSAGTEIAAAEPPESKIGSVNSDTSKSFLLSTPKPPEPAQTSSSAFANSGFGALASSTTSGFGTIGASKPSVFGGSAPTSISGFGSFGGAKPESSTPTDTTTSAFGGVLGNKPVLGFGSGSTASAGFGGGEGSSVFGSALSNGFAGGSGPKLSNFAAPGKADIPLVKPVKAFGAPESDQEDGSDDEGSYAGSGSDGEDAVEERKKSKLPRVPIEDGESGEATLLQVRAKLFALESKATGWKERGSGTLKINVPRSCASFDGNGQAIPGSFDISGLEDEEEEESSTPRVPRLIMRQENTHRVILNSIIVRAMKFEEKPSSKAAQIVFTAVEGEKELKPINMLLRISEANARLFLSETSSIQHELP